MMMYTKGTPFTTAKMEKQKSMSIIHYCLHRVPFMKMEPLYLMSTQTKTTKPKKPDAQAVKKNGSMIPIFLYLKVYSTSLQLKKNKDTNVNPLLYY